MKEEMLGGVWSRPVMGMKEALQIQGEHPRTWMTLDVP